MTYTQKVKRVHTLLMKYSSYRRYLGNRSISLETVAAAATGNYTNATIQDKPYLPSVFPLDRLNALMHLGKV